jgi:nucleoside-diphosphate-sugar epimerase
LQTEGYVYGDGEDRDFTYIDDVVNAKNILKLGADGVVEIGWHGSCLIRGYVRFIGE